MHSFQADYFQRVIDSIPSRTMQVATSIAEYKGRQELYYERALETLVHLRENAVIRSVESSNRLEGIEVKGDNLAEMLSNNKNMPNKNLDRPAYEILGYRDVLKIIYENYKNIHLRPSDILSLHHKLFARTGYGYGGKWKHSHNDIIEKTSTGERILRFETIKPFLVEKYMNELCEYYAKEIEMGRVSCLIVIALYIFDFLCIHPFQDGNGRMARLLANKLLLKFGYDVPLYISLERVIWDSKENYYDSLKRSSQGWHESQHHIWHWVDYFLWVLLDAYKQWDKNISSQQGQGYSRHKQTVLFALENVEKEFTIRRLEKQCRDIPREAVKRVLKDLSNEGRLRCVQRGRYARWRKLGSWQSSHQHYGDKTRRVLATIEKRLGDSFTFDELAQSCHGVSKDLLRSILATQRRKGTLICSGRGRYARWHKVLMVRERDDVLT